MTAFIQGPPIWKDVSSEDYQLWFEQVSKVINQNAVFGTSATTSGTVSPGLAGLSLDTTTGEVTQDDVLYGYFNRFLHIRFASDADGTNQILSLLQYSGSTIYIGTHNSSTRVIGEDANFVYRPFTFSANHILQYSIEGGRRIDIQSETELEDSFTSFIVPTIIDLDNLDAMDGSTPIAYYSSRAINNKPTGTPADEPLQWVRQDIAATSITDFNWIIWGLEGLSDTFTEYNLGVSGSTGQGVFTPGDREEGNIIVNTSASVDSSTNPGQAEELYVYLTGESSTAGMAEATAFFNAIQPDQLVTSISFIRFTTDRSILADVWNLFQTGVSIDDAVAGTDYEYSINSEIEVIRNDNIIHEFQPTGTIELLDTGSALTIFITSPGSTLSSSSFGNTNVTFRTTAAASSVTIDIPTESINETIELGLGLTTATALRNDLLASLQSITAITDEFTITSDTSSGISGLTDGSPIVKFVANDTLDHSIAITFNSGGGDLTGSLAGTISEGVPGVVFVTPIVRITYDPSDTPAFSDIMFIGSESATSIANVIQSTIQSQTEYSATIDTDNNRRVNFHKNIAEASQNIAITVTTQGSSNLVNSFFAVTITQNGTDGTTVGNPGSYTIVINGATTLTGSLPGQSAEQITDIIRQAINNEGTFFSFEISDTLLNVRAVNAGANSLTAAVNPGSGNAAKTLVLITEGTAGGFNPIGAINQFKGADGVQGAFRISAFRRFADGVTIVDPTGGNLNTPPSGWLYTVPTGDDTLYESFVIYNPVSDTSTTDLGTRWSTPFQAGNNGPSGTNGVGSATRFIYNSNARNLTPTLPSASNTVDNGWTTSISIAANWFALQVNVTSTDGTTVSTYGDWQGPNLTTGADGINPVITQNADGSYTITDGAGNTATVEDGTPGSNGDDVDIIFARNTQQPTTPSPSAGVPSGWFATVDTVPASAGAVYASVGQKAADATNFTWNAPVQLEGLNPVVSKDGDTVTITDGEGNTATVSDGTDGTNPVVTDNGDGTFTITDGDGDSVTVSDGTPGSDGDDVDIVFIRASSQPNTPASSIGVPPGWSATVADLPAGSNPIWSSVGTKAGTATSFTWNAAVQLEGSDGDTGPEGDSVTVIFRRLLGTPPTPSPSAGVPVLWSATIAGLPLGTGLIWSSVGTKASGQTLITWNDPVQLEGEDGDNGAPGSAGAGWYSYATNDTQTELDNAPQSTITAGFLLSAGRSPVAGDVLLVTGVENALRAVVRNSANTSWLAQASFINGNLLVAGTVTATEIAANTITADRLNVSNLAAISANLGTITAGSIDASQATITNLNADNITAGTLNADRIQLDDATLDTDDNGNLVVQTISGGGIVSTSSGLGVSVDGSTVVINNGQLEAVAPTTTINTVTWTGGQTAKSYPINDPVSVVGANSTQIFEDSIINWRYDMNTIGAAQYGALTGITLENFDVSLSVTNAVQQRPTLSNIRFDLTYRTASGTTTGFNLASTFDGQIRLGDLQPTTISGSASGSGSGTFSTIDTQFAAPSGGGRFLFLGWLFRATLSSNAFYDVGDVTYTVTVPSQSDTRLVLHFENGTSITETFNNFFISL